MGTTGSYKNLLCLGLLFVSVRSWGVPAEGHRIMMAGPEPHATAVAKKIILKGGNVIDVAVAVGLTLSVTTPFYAALGAGGFALIKMNKKPVKAIDFRETAPLKTHPTYYLKKAKDASVNGPHAVGTPGFPAGLWHMHKKYGKLHWSQLFDEPIRLASKGFRVSGHWVKTTERVLKKFNPEGIKHLHLSRRQKRIPKPGELLRQPGLAKALKLMRNRGIVPFYEGEIGRDIVATVKGLGGVLSMDDFKNYKVRWLNPIITEFMGNKLYMMPPPSSGGVVLKQAFALSEFLEIKKHSPLSSNELHLLGEVLKVSFRGRMLLGDPDFHKNPIDKLTNRDRLKKLSTEIKGDDVLKIKPIEVVKYNDSHETTHFSVMDNNGNAIALTVTLNTSYGSKVISKKYGIALNNEMDDFTTRPGEANTYGLIQGQGNKVQPGKRPLSSMSPTLVERNGKIVAAVGGQGGSRIISGVFQTLYRLLVNGYNIERAIETPRIHHQFLPDFFDYEKDRFSLEIIEKVKEKGHKVREGLWQSKVYGVSTNSKGNIEGASDSRSEGSAGGI